MKRTHVWSKRKTRIFQGLLLGWYERNRRDLPWRNQPTPYRVWIAEVMLQQTQVKVVLPYFNSFMRRFPNITRLASASEDEVMALWAGLGYYGRARNICRVARIVVQQYAEIFPDSLETIAKLPGIGRYTAAAIHSIAFNQPQPIVDGNVRRVISRLLAITAIPPETFFWQQAKAWLAEKRPSDFNQAVMELGALICKPAIPRCPVCPVRLLCRAHHMGIQHSIPEPRPKRALENVNLVVLVLESEGKVLLTKKQAVEYVPGEWSLPTQILTGEMAPEIAAQKFVRSILGKSILTAERMLVRHSITRRRIQAHVFHADVKEYRIKQPAHGKIFFADASRRRQLITSSLYKKALRSALRG
jgi:A/G-specific adenine glycosylase